MVRLFDTLARVKLGRRAGPGQNRLLLTGGAPAQSGVKGRCAIPTRRASEGSVGTPLAGASGWCVQRSLGSLRGATRTARRNLLAHPSPGVRSLANLVALLMLSGCAIAPRSRMDECQQLAQTLRADNARLKDRVLALQSQNRDYAERAVDDGRRLATQDEAIARLEHGVQAYQDERVRLEAAYQQLVTNLGGAGPTKNAKQIAGARGAIGEDSGRSSPDRVFTGDSGPDQDAPR